MDVYRGMIVLYVSVIVSVSLKIALSKPVFEMDMNGDSETKQDLEQRKLVFLSTPSNDSYILKRQEILLTEQQWRVGGEIVLRADENKVNTKLLDLKRQEYDAAHYNNVPFGPQLNFLNSRHLYEKSEVFKMIQRMPKGGALHVHDCSMLTLDKLVFDVTYRKNCYMCTDAQNSLAFHFFTQPPVNPDCPWVLVNEARQQSGNATEFDNMLIQSMSITSSYVGMDISTVWKRFEHILVRANGLINYAPVFRDYFVMALQEFHDDGVQYVEVRALLPKVYNLDGSILNTTQVMEIYVNATEKFKQSHANFTGAKIIKTNLRVLSVDVIKSDIIDSIQMMAKYPDYFAGYDLVGQEDPGLPLLSYLDALQYPAQQNPPINLPYFFHAGETDWEGTRVDDNLIDAILLNTTRIGHGYAITKHPQVMKIVKEKQIALEINPISNQVLRLVDNLQNHPGATLIANGFPVVISSDDNSVWGARGLSYDFYAAFMVLAGRDDGLKLLKQLAMNSLIYSAMSNSQKAAALKLWEENWNKFIENELYLSVSL